MVDKYSHIPSLPFTFGTARIQTHKPLLICRVMLTSQPLPLPWLFDSNLPHQLGPAAGVHQLMVASQTAVYRVITDKSAWHRSPTLLVTNCHWASTSAGRVDTLHTSTAIHHPVKHQDAKNAKNQIIQFHLLVIFHYLSTPQLNSKNVAHLLLK